MVSETVPDKGWSWMVMVASFFSHLILGSFLNCVGVFHTALLSKFEQNVTYTSLAGAIFTSLMSSTGPLSSLLINRFNCRKTIMFGGLIFAAGCFVSAFLPSLEWVILTYGVIAGIGSGITYTASFVVVGFNFEIQRNLASGFAVSGGALGAFVFAPIFTTLENVYGYEGLFILSAGLAFHICVCGALCRPSQLENMKKQDMYKDNNGCSLQHVTSYIKLLGNLSFLCICISMFCWSIGVYMAYLHLPQYAITMKSTPLQASWILSAAGISGCFSRVMAGLASNNENIDEILIYSGSFGILGLCTMLFPLYVFTFSGQLFYGVILGIYSGSCYAVLNSINIAIVGMCNFATAYGVELVFCGLGTLLGPPLAGLIVDNGGTYQLSFVIGGFAITLGAVFGMLTVCFKCEENNFPLAETTTVEIVPDSETKHDELCDSDSQHIHAEPLINRNKTGNIYQESPREKTLKFIDDVDI